MSPGGHMAAYLEGIASRGWRVALPLGERGRCCISFALQTGVLALTLACGASAQIGTRKDCTDGIGDRYSRLFGHVLLSPDSMAALDSLPLDSVWVVSSNGFGSPNTTIKFRKTGRADDRFDSGTAATVRTGNLPPRDWMRLNFVVEYLALSSMDSSYFVAISDIPTAWIYLAWTDGRIQAIRDNGLRGPPPLWAFEAIVENLRKDVQWGPERRRVK